MLQTDLVFSTKTSILKNSCFCFLKFSLEQTLLPSFLKSQYLIKHYINFYLLAVPDKLFFQSYLSYCIYCFIYKIDINIYTIFELKLTHELLLNLFMVLLFIPSMFSLLLLAAKIRKKKEKRNFIRIFNIFRAWGFIKRYVKILTKISKKRVRKVILQINFSIFL